MHVSSDTTASPVAMSHRPARIEVVHCALTASLYVCCSGPSESSASTPTWQPPAHPPPSSSAPSEVCRRVYCMVPLPVGFLEACSCHDCAYYSSAAGCTCATGATLMYCPVMYCSVMPHDSCCTTHANTHLVRQLFQCAMYSESVQYGVCCLSPQGTDGGCPHSD